MSVSVLKDALDKFENKFTPTNGVLLEAMENLQTLKQLKKNLLDGISKSEKEYYNSMKVLGELAEKVAKKHSKKYYLGVDDLYDDKDVMAKAIEKSKKNIIDRIDYKSDETQPVDDFYDTKHGFIYWSNHDGFSGGADGLLLDDKDLKTIDKILNDGKAEPYEEDL